MLLQVSLYVRASMHPLRHLLANTHPNIDYRSLGKSELLLNFAPSRHFCQVVIYIIATWLSAAFCVIIGSGL